MNKLLSAAIGFAIAASVSFANADTVNKATFTGDGAVNIPTGYHSWIYIGTPLTPNALNDGEAPFPEFHNVYIEPSA